MSSLDNGIGRLARLFHWQTPQDHSVLALNFDEINASLYFWKRLPRYTFPDVLSPVSFSLLVVFQAVLYLVFLGALLDLLNAPTLTTVAKVAGFGVALQFLYAVFYTLIGDAYHRLETPIRSLIYRSLRTTLFLLPFSFIPEWLIGCMLWMFVPLRLNWTTYFYDQAYNIGPSIRYGVAFIGAAPGSVAENFTKLTIMATDHRTRYFDITTDTSRRFMLVIGLCMLYFLITNFTGPMVFQNISLFGFVIDGRMLGQGYIFIIPFMMFAYFSFNAVCSVCALSFCIDHKFKRPEPELPAATGVEWLSFVPHAIFGFVFYALIVWVVIGKWFR